MKEHLNISSQENIDKNDRTNVLPKVGYIPAKAIQSHKNPYNSSSPRPVQYTNHTINQCYSITKNLMTAYHHQVRSSSHEDRWEHSATPDHVSLFLKAMFSSQKAKSFPNTTMTQSTGSGTPVLKNIIQQDVMRSGMLSGSRAGTTSMYLLIR